MAAELRELRAALDELRARDRELNVFGASAHRYQTHPATKSHVASFERARGVRLPNAFRQLLLEVTDGGVGPGHGMFALERAKDDEVAEDLTLLARPFDEVFFHEPPPPDPEGTNDERYEAATLAYWREMPGSMTLCHYGCAIRAYLVVTGERAGQVVLDRRSDFAGVAPFTRAEAGNWNCLGRPPSSNRTPLDVVAWYRDWIDASLAWLGAGRPIG